VSALHRRGAPAKPLTTPHHEAASDEATFGRASENDQHRTSPERRSQQIHASVQEAIASEEPYAREPDILDWLLGR
jgi:hypothetical protein